ncbi:ABC transporter substrate-binding protein [Comamonas endophytica]|uniref:ABC transporter substrate-binding protein n=1 Tax=Comamonas endophytica TaxID=2949090 RepID=A0ABY6GFD8_9BURK|nr:MULTISPECIES: ABC transporter substrate-binding protein [unclassified Acidovorax]MCD2513398.1 ABC transporter substrate-binding protein [Acidovorax sp. D4N7]UYG53819.1 ABC transporter substrate-binding protein [Acidovorax sp. 5MLIR]
MKALAKIVVSTLIAFGISQSALAQAGKPVDKVLVTEAFHSLLYLPVYVAKHEGIFQKHNIDVPVVRSAGSGPTALASVLAGEAQFSVHGPEHVGFAQQRGGKAKAVSAVANSAPVWILARKDVAYQKPSDMKGKRVTVGLAPGTSNTLLKRFLIANNLKDKTDVTVTEVQNGSELGPVLAGQSDFSVAYQPQVEQGLAQGMKMVHAFTGEYPEYAFSTINTSQQLIEKNPALVGRFVQAINDSLKYMRANPDAAKAVARKEFASLDAAVVNSAVQRMLDSNVYPANVQITEKAFKTAIDMQKFVGNIKTDMHYGDIVQGAFTQSVMAAK